MPSGTGSGRLPRPVLDRDARGHPRPSSRRVPSSPATSVASRDRGGHHARSTCPSFLVEVVRRAPTGHILTMVARGYPAAARAAKLRACMGSHASKLNKVIAILSLYMSLI
jgi:hypothetical protein